MIRIILVYALQAEELFSISEPFVVFSPHHIWGRGHYHPSPITCPKRRQS